MEEGAINQVGGGGVKTRKTGRHDGKHCQTRYTYSFSCPFLLPDDLLHLVVDISVYCSRRYDTHNDSGSNDTASYPRRGSRLVAIRFTDQSFGWVSTYSRSLFCHFLMFKQQSHFFRHWLKNQLSAIESRLQNTALNQALCKFILPLLLPQPLMFIDLPSAQRQGHA